VASLRCWRSADRSADEHRLGASIGVFAGEAPSKVLAAFRNELRHWRNLLSGVGAHLNITWRTTVNIWRTVIHCVRRLGCFKHIVLTPVRR
jgi:hypothetical protein